MASWTETQARRLEELGAAERELERLFSSCEERDRNFHRLEQSLVREHRERLVELRRTRLRPGLCRLEAALSDALISRGFVQIVTPTIMSRGLLERMSIDAGHPLNKQIFWLDKNRCLRPMLAPHLYYVLKDLLRLWEKPVRIFEVGSCFRRESRGAQHSIEFTMLNLVEMGVDPDSRRARMEEMVALIARAAGIGPYTLKPQQSVVYGETIDIVCGARQTEVGSGALGPHPLDEAWKIAEPWIGIGFGLERLLMVAQGGRNLARFGRSLSYLDGMRLNV